MQSNSMTEEYKEAGRYLMHLIRCGLQGENAKAKPDSITWEQVYDLARNNSVEGVSFYGVETVAELLPRDLYARWRTERDRTCFRMLSFDEERSHILDRMREKGLSFLPLKGILLSEYYPKPGMRSMADNDILYGFVEENAEGKWQIRGETDKEQKESTVAAQKVMVSIMEERNYQIETLQGNHDSYIKKPFYNFEMHRRLMAKSSPFYPYYENPWERAVKDENDQYLFHFSHEDEYVYLLAHAFKHFDGSGCGIRFVIDLYVYMKALGDSLDCQYIDERLCKMGLKAFEKKIKDLADTAFGGDEKLSSDQEDLLYYLLGCRTYGNLQTRIANNLNKLKTEPNENRGHIKLKYLWQRLFLTEQDRKNYPFFTDHKYLLPFLPVYRVIKGVCMHPKQLWKELVTLRKMH